jgi:hypothetical protein
LLSLFFFFFCWLCSLRLLLHNKEILHLPALPCEKDCKKQDKVKRSTQTTSGYVQRYRQSRASRSHQYYLGISEYEPYHHHAGEFGKMTAIVSRLETKLTELENEEKIRLAQNWPLLRQKRQ